MAGSRDKVDELWGKRKIERVRTSKSSVGKNCETEKAVVTRTVCVNSKATRAHPNASAAASNADAVVFAFGFLFHLLVFPSRSVLSGR